ncbi:saccharopine dehydrogenase family protein [Flavihumibacter profundi]|uniref:saccharopine dehydrogenase family protein n=1 Tax=Flavihumibacter profundi TaxID=2716883 RepID=UPI001CC77BDA|nr:saccharopine dehydrogenase NADP-binding domain-containing protein [Flavihumibacter profundi]MBZ5857431.1 saccharopine dehydrogenase NADP-binding domain-containing protein [Flavihumibacter profundi]
MSANLLLYGANGYTGKLITETAALYGLQPILAGRNKAAIQQLSEEYNLPYRIAGLNDPGDVDALLDDIDVVLHAAGPFSITSKPMIEACIRNKVHYIDITGEIPVFEMARKFHEEARAAGIMIMPGAGFDVVPTDCMALSLKEQLPDATHLELAFTSPGGGISHGTATTMVQSLGQDGAIRQNGLIISKPIGYTTRKVEFGKSPILVMSIPWGDISTAYHTTGIPNIITYTGINPGIYRILKLQKLFNWFLQTNWARKKAQDYINRKPAGPSAEERKRGKSLVWGEVSNARGERKTGRLSGPDGYTLTAHSSLIIARKILEGNFCAGYQTPAGCYGANLILEIPGTEKF